MDTHRHLRSRGSSREDNLMSKEHNHKLAWKDCDKKGHEEGCYVALCEQDGCNWKSYDCEEVEK